MVSWCGKTGNSFSDGPVDLVAGDMKACKGNSTLGEVAYILIEGNPFVNASTKKALTWAIYFQSYMNTSLIILQNP